MPTTCAHCSKQLNAIQQQGEINDENCHRLPCAHSYCSPCLETMQRDNQLLGRATLDCHECMELFATHMDCGVADESSQFDVFHSFINTTFENDTTILGEDFCAPTAAAVYNNNVDGKFVANEMKKEVKQEAAATPTTNDRIFAPENGALTPNRGQKVRLHILQLENGTLKERNEELLRENAKLKRQLQKQAEEEAKKAQEAQEPDDPEENGTNFCMKIEKTSPKPQQSISDDAHLQLQVKANCFCFANINTQNQWNSDVCVPGLKICAGDLVAEHQQDANNCTVRATQPFAEPFEGSNNKCVCDRPKMFYFEAKILKRTNCIYIGLCDGNFALTGECIGKSGTSFGMNNYGNFWAEGQFQGKFMSCGFSEGDIVGCGLLAHKMPKCLVENVENGDGDQNDGDEEGMEQNCELFFTKNGKFIVVQYISLPSPIQLYPAVTLWQNGAQVKGNFGASAFRYDLLKHGRMQ